VHARIARAAGPRRHRRRPRHTPDSLLDQSPHVLSAEPVDAARLAPPSRTPLSSRQTRESSTDGLAPRGPVHLPASGHADVATINPPARSEPRRDWRWVRRTGQSASRRENRNPAAKGRPSGGRRVPFPVRPESRNDPQ